MFRYSDNFYQRKCFLKQEQVPTQSVMKNKMGPSLTQVYFKSMNSKLKVLAGLEPPMKGGGSDWYVPPKDLLKGEAIFKPEKKQYLSQLGFNGINELGNKFEEDHQKSLEEEKRQALLKSDLKWKKLIVFESEQEYDHACKHYQHINTQKIKHAYQEFCTIYRNSITSIESVLTDAAVKEVKRIEQETYDKMMSKYKNTLKEQAIMLSNRYEEKFMKKKAEIKAHFINQVENARNDLGKQLHDIKVEKHRAIEKVRNLLECQNMACQVYVALKEREEYQKERDLSIHEHKKQVKTLDAQILMQDFEIKLLKEKERKRQEFYDVWRKKICHVVKRFQIFVEYCLTELPEHAQFFIDMEKLMLLQIEQSLSDATTESLFVSEKPEYKPPVPPPHPFFLYRDKNDRVKVDKDLCPVHCTSSASIMPVIVINKKCIYAACDNFELFSDKIREYVGGRRGDDADFEHSHNFNLDVPVKYTTSQQLQELKLESSLMQILQQQIPNVHEVPLKCCICQVPYCFCSPLHASRMSLDVPPPEKEPSIEFIPSGTKITSRQTELRHDREPKIESYLKYMKPKKCSCKKTVKKDLEAHLPPYMRKMSVYEDFELPHYEPCTVGTIKKLVSKAMHKKPPPPEPVKVPSNTKDISTQYSDQQFDSLCQCLSDDEITKFFNDLATCMSSQKCNVLDGSNKQDYLSQTPTLFASDRALSLRMLLKDDPQLEEIFKRCDD